MDKKIRQPKQDRAKDKKKKIIEAAYDIFSEVGFYNTNTTDIAKKAGVSTGIVYGYFSDKRDILLYVIDIYIEKVSEPFKKYVSKFTAPLDFNNVVTDLLNLTMETHKSNANIHNILHSLAVTDTEINQKFLVLEDNITFSISDKLKDLGLCADSLKEKVHVAMNSIQSFAHEYVYDNHDYIDYEKMKSVVIQMVVSLFE